MKRNEPVSPASNDESIQALLVEQLRELGATVYELAPGMPTLLVGYGGKTTLLDVRTAANRSSAGFAETWRGAGAHDVATLTQACRAMGLRFRAVSKRTPRKTPPPAPARPKKRAA